MVPSGATRNWAMAKEAKRPVIIKATNSFFIISTFVPVFSRLFYCGSQSEAKQAPA